MGLTPEILCLIMFFCTLGLLILGFPVAFTLAGVSLLFGFLGTMLGMFDMGFISAFPQRIYQTMINLTLVAVPLFIFMGVMLERSKIAEELLENMGRMFGKMPGGLGYSVCIVGALLAASTGIVGATVVTMGLMALPVMLRRGYDPAFASGSIAASGTLGQIIPPSIVLVLLGDQLAIAYQTAQFRRGIFAPDTTSVNDLFAGALIPGLVLVGMYIVYQIMVATFQPHKAPAVPQETDRVKPPRTTVDKVFDYTTYVVIALFIFLIIETILGVGWAESLPLWMMVFAAFAFWAIAGNYKLLPSERTGPMIGLACLGVLVVTDLIIDPTRSFTYPLGNQTVFNVVVNLFYLAMFAGVVYGMLVNLFKHEFYSRVTHALVAPVVLIVAVLGSILGGLASPTEAAGVGAIGATLLAGYRVNEKKGWPILLAAAATVVMLYLSSMFDLRVQRNVIPFTDGVVIVICAILSLIMMFGLATALWRVFSKRFDDGKRILASVCESTLIVTTMVFTIIIGAAMFALVFRGFGGDVYVEHFLENLPGGTLGAILIVMLVMFVMGFFLDFLEIIFIVVPIVAPILLQMDIAPGVSMSPVWLGVMMAVNLQTSFLTPPFGFALFYLRGVAPSSVKTTDIYRGIIPFVCIQIFMLVVLWNFPTIATWLPELIYGARRF